MRIIHTSDWHLGQNFYSKSRAAEHSAFLDWLLTSAQAHEVDAIIVAGDIFDTGSPPSYARELYNRFVVQLQQTGCQLVVLAGNHDSVATLNESRDILAFLKTTVVASAGHAPLFCRSATAPPAPYLPGPLPAPARAGHQPGRTLQRRKTAAAVERHQRLLSAAVRSGLRPARRSSAADRRQRPPDHRRRQQKRCGARYLHRHAGGISRQPFSPVDYIALGHIHRAQRLAAANIFATAAPPSPSALMRQEKAKASIW